VFSNADPTIPTPIPVEIDLDAIPDVDMTQHTVPLGDIFFDTFRSTNRAVALPSADAQLIRRLRDAIPPLYEPRFETAVSAKWLSEHDFVLGYAAGDEAYAYPFKILNFHEIASHEVNGIPIMATYCPLCRSGVVYDRRIDGEGEPLLFGNTSALYESDMVMLDHKTGSYWVQVSGEAVVGPLSGTSLTVLPSQTTTWGAWQAQHPNTLVLSQNTGFDRNYTRDPFSGYREQLNATERFAFPVTEAVDDPRLGPGDVVLGVEVGEAVRAYPLEQLGNAAVNDEIGETAVVVFSHERGPTGAAYLAEVNGRLLTFTFVDDHYQDAETSSQWNLSGRATAGELAGTQLEPLPVRSSLWFALIAAFPDLVLHTP
ncbi:MAG: DUF3179 domain-containing protein, partial [Chloroflexota bacterium]